MFARGERRSWSGRRRAGRARPAGAWAGSGHARTGAAGRSIGGPHSGGRPGRRARTGTAPTGPGAGRAGRRGVGRAVLVVAVVRLAHEQQHDRADAEQDQDSAPMAIRIQDRPRRRLARNGLARASRVGPAASVAGCGRLGAGRGRRGRLTLSAHTGERLTGVACWWSSYGLQAVLLHLKRRACPARSASSVVDVNLNVAVLVGADRPRCWSRPESCMQTLAALIGAFVYTFTTVPETSGTVWRLLIRRLDGDADGLRVGRRRAPFFAVDRRPRDVRRRCPRGAEPASLYGVDRLDARSTAAVGDAGSGVGRPWRLASR